MQNSDDPLAKFRRPNAPASTQAPVVSSDGIRLREYKAFTQASTRASMLLFKSALIKKRAEADLALPYGYLTAVNSDGYGFGFSLFFSTPFPQGPTVVEIRGEGLTPLIDTVLKQTASIIQIFDPVLHFPTPAGHFDEGADAWIGPPVVKDITITVKTTPSENSTRH